MGVLYLIGTPIGNLDDITIRALHILKSVHLVACEDTRVARKLLNHYGIQTKTISCNSHNWVTRINRLSKELDEHNVAYVSDAGMPSISDPGWEITSELRELGYSVEVIPGVSSVTTALTNSGIDASHFSFLGFLPRKQNEALSILSDYFRLGTPVVFFESPHRLAKSLQRIHTEFGDIHITICRELTKFYEEIFSGTIEEAIDHFSEPRGEFVVVIHPDQYVNEHQLNVNAQEALSLEITRMKSEGIQSKQAIKEISQKLNIRRNVVYKAWINS